MIHINVNVYTFYMTSVYIDMISHLIITYRYIYI